MPGTLGKGHTLASILFSFFTLYYFFYIFTLNSQSSCIIFPGTGITGMDYQVWLFYFLGRHVETLLVDLPPIT